MPAMRIRSSILFFVVAASHVEGLFNPKFWHYGDTSISLPIDISNLYDSRAFASGPNDANMDGLGSGYPASYMPPTSFVYSGINFTFPSYQASGNDNVRASGQNISVPSAKYFDAQLLAASEGGSLTEGSISATYADSSTESNTVLVPVWWYDYLFGGDIVFPFYFSKDGVYWNKSMIYLVSTNLDSSKELVSLQLPAESSGIHVFSLSMWPAAGTSNTSLEVQSARSTQKWMGENNVQIVEVLVNNVGTQWITSNNTVKVSIQSPGYETVTPAIIKRLRPGDQVKVEVGVTPTGAVGSTGKATVIISEKTAYATYDFQATFGIVPYEATFESIYSHESPGWFDESKYGIFIHWGLYSIPAWGNSGSNETYAEWYWWNMNAGADTSDRTHQFNLENYGPDHEYDDFTQNFTASAWDPKEWVDLFANAGANYFVQVTKHHAGFALFNVSSDATLRTSVAQSPHRNFVQELFDAAEEYQPHLRRGTYFSLPEWFNPAYAPYGMGR